MHTWDAVMPKETSTQKHTNSKENWLFCLLSFEHGEPGSGYRFLGFFFRILESLWLENTSKIIQFNCQPITPCPLTSSLRATSPCFLNTSRDSDFTIPLGSLCHCLTTSSEKNFFLTSWTSPGITWGHFLSSYHCYPAEETDLHLTAISF